MNALLQISWLPALGWVLLHSLWESTLVVLVAAFALRLLRGGSPRLRYFLAVLALIISAGMPLRHLVAARPTPSRIILIKTEAPLKGLAVGRPVPALPSALRTRLMGGLNPALPWIVLLWVCGVLLSLFRLGGGWALLQHLRWRKSHLAPDHLQGTLLSLCRKAGLKRAVTLLTCDGIIGPSVVGVLRPAILVPSGWFLNMDPLHLEALLAHELAHMLRHDYVVNLLQSLIEVTMFYHPCVWWISRRIRAERELASDAFAVRLTGDPLPLAEALAHLERRGINRVSLEPALAAHGGSLMERISLLLLPKRRTSSAPLFGALALMLLATASALPLLAQTVKASVAVAKDGQDTDQSIPSSMTIHLKRRNVTDQAGVPIPYTWVVDITANNAPLYEVWEGIKNLMKMEAGPRGECNSYLRVDERFGRPFITLNLTGATPAEVMVTLETLAQKFGVPPFKAAPLVDARPPFSLARTTASDGTARFTLQAEQVSLVFLERILNSAKEEAKKVNDVPSRVLVFERNSDSGPGLRVDAIHREVSLQGLEQIINKHIAERR